MSSPSRIPILRVGTTLIAPIQLDLHDRVADEFQQDLLDALARNNATGLVCDISSLEMVDSYVARKLVDTGTMARLMGATTVLVGMRPEVAATLVRMGYGMEGVHTAADLEEGLALVAKLVGRARRR